MEPLEFLLGVAAFNVVVKFKKPLRKAAVVVTSQALGIADRFKTAAYGFKEEFEDIVAEAHYENMKKVKGGMGETEEDSGGSQPSDNLQ